MMKKCFKCGEEKELCDFYKHKQMADGHLNKCKECTKKDSFGRTEEQIEKRKYRDRNRTNHKDRIKKNKERREWLRDNDPIKYKAIEIKKTEWANRNKHKRNAHGKVSRAVMNGTLKRPIECSLCGDTGRIEAHHEDYDKPLEVVWLCTKCHANAHKKDK